MAVAVRPVAVVGRFLGKVSAKRLSILGDASVNKREARKSRWKEAGVNLPVADPQYQTPLWHSGLVNSPGESPTLHSISQITGTSEQNTSY